MRVLIADDRLLRLGKQGENHALQVRFPIADWITAYGHGTFQLINKRHGDPAPYIVSVTYDDEYVYWLVTSSDVANVGMGECELVLLIDDVVAKSRTWATQTVECLGEPGEAPEPWQSWVDEVLLAGNQAKESAEAAKESAEEAKEIIESIVDDTLSEPGKAADAKKTGDRFTELDEEIKGKYSAPEGGIPESDLDEEVRKKLNSGGGGSVTSVNGKTGDVRLTAEDVDALPSDTPIPPAYDDTAIRQLISGKQNTITDLSAIRSGAAAGATALQSGDLASWAKQPNKPSYTAQEVGALPANTPIPPDVSGEISEIKDDLTQKITAPENPVVGKVLKVLSVNDDGTFTCEWADGGAGGVTDVTVDGTSVVEDGIATIPNANASTKGVVALQIESKYGLTWWSSTNHILTPSLLNESEVDSRLTMTTAQRRPLMLNRVDYIVKAAMCDGKGPAWTAEEQAAAQQRLGIIALTQEEYDLMESPSESTIYVIVEAAT